MLTTKEQISEKMKIAQELTSNDIDEVFDSLMSLYDDGKGSVTRDEAGEITYPIASHKSTAVKEKLMAFDLISTDSLLKIISEDKIAYGIFAKFALNRYACNEEVLIAIGKKAAQGYYGNESLGILNRIKEHKNAPKWLVRRIDVETKDIEGSYDVKLYVPSVPSWIPPLIATFIILALVAVFFAVRHLN